MELSALVIRMAVYTILVCTLLFASAGTVRWPSAWAWIVLATVSQTITLGVVYRKHPDLMTERSRVQSGTKKWDKVLVFFLVALGPLVMFVIAGLDYRWHGARLVWWAIPAGLAAALVGAVVTAWAMYTNRFFAATVRIQTDRGHVVVSGGPYAWVRHPGYVGMFLSYAAMPFVMSSTWTLTPTAVMLVLLVVRTALEDGTLRAELPGYAEYAGTTRWRLLPGVW